MKAQFKPNRALRALLALPLVLLLSACGASSRDNLGTEIGNDQGADPGDWVDPGEDDDDDGGGTGGIGIPPEEFNFSIRGSSGGTPVLSPSGGYVTQSDDVLRVKVTSGDGVVQVTGNDYTNYQGGYGCVQYTVKVNDYPEKTTPVLRYGDGNAMVTQCNVYGFCWQSYMNCCPTAPESTILNFNSQIANHGDTPLRIKVTKVKYPRVQGCTLQPIYSTHKLTGTLLIQTNQTDGF
ncbi:MAG: hypothetical protein IT285_02350 [Bdellovibrionales bacterium]|nr:hypothetical protein [Bdellovibrionales bacterium]